MTEDAKQSALNLEIRAQMVRARRSAIDVCRVLGISQPQVSYRLSGKIDWKITELWKIADLIGMTLPELLVTAESATRAERVSA